MKVLLLTDIPPTKEFTAGLVLDQLCRFMPQESLCCFAVVNPDLDLQVSADLSGIPIVFRPKPNENWTWLGTGPLASAAAWLGEHWTKRFPVKALLQEAIQFGREQQVDRVWAVLQGQTIIRLAGPLAERLQVPLYAQVWDPFSWWASANRLDHWTTRSISREFDSTVQNSVACATASHAMAELFRQRYGTRAIPLISSHCSSIARLPALNIGTEEVLSIGIAGQFYAVNEWRNLVHAMNCAGWQVAGRRVAITVVGPQEPPTPPTAHVKYLGWKTQAEAIEVLSHCDILYCPYPFDPERKEVAQLSFPSKLVLYFASGRPIIFHGPSYSSPHSYLQGNGAALCCNRIEASAIFNELERLVRDPRLYEAVARAGHAAFLKDFTLEQMARSFARFIGLADDGGVRLHDHTSRVGSMFPVCLAPNAKKRGRPLLQSIVHGLLHPLAQLRLILSRREITFAQNAGDYGKPVHSRGLVAGARRTIGLLLRHSPYFWKLYVEIDALHVQLRNEQRTKERLSVQLAETKAYLEKRITDLDVCAKDLAHALRNSEARANKLDQKFRDAETRANDFAARIQELSVALGQAQVHGSKATARARAMELESRELRYYLGEQSRPAAGLWPRPPVSETTAVPSAGVKLDFAKPEELNDAARAAILETDVVLDLGCGIRPMAFFRPRVHVCVEPHREYVQILSQMAANQPQLVILQAEALDLVRALADQSVDSVFLIDVIEHIRKEDGFEIVKECHRIARRQIAVFTPLGFLSQEYEDEELDAWGLAGTELQRHRSGWTPNDFGEHWSFLCCENYHTLDAKGRKRDQPAGAFWAFLTAKSDRAHLLQHALVIARRLPPAAAQNALWQELWRTLAEFGSDSITCITSPEYSEFSAHIQPRPTRLTAPYHYLSFAAVPTITNDMSWTAVVNCLPSTLIDQISDTLPNNTGTSVLILVEEAADAAIGALVSKLTQLPVLLVHDGTTNFQDAVWFEEIRSGSLIVVKTIQDVLSNGRPGFVRILDSISHKLATS